MLDISEDTLYGVWIILTYFKKMLSFVQHAVKFLVNPFPPARFGCILWVDPLWFSTWITGVALNLKHGLYC